MSNLVNVACGFLKTSIVVSFFAAVACAAAAQAVDVSSSDSGTAAEAVASAAYPPDDATVLKHDDGKLADKDNVGGSGYFIGFQAPEGAWYLVAVDVCAGRYGTPLPADKWQITLCDEGGKTMWTILEPYTSIESGEPQWRRIAVPPVALPETKAGKKAGSFWLNLAFDSNKSRGANVGHDAPKAANNSRVGMPDGPMQNTAAKFDWMIRAVISENPGTPPGGLGEWLGPLIEIKYDGGQPDGMWSQAGVGPVVHFQSIPDNAVLQGFTLYAWRGGMGADAAARCDYWVVSENKKTLLAGSIPYSAFGQAARWLEVETKKIAVPGSFWFVINPRADARRYINFHYFSTNIKVSHAKMGSAPGDYRDTGQKFEWMIRAWVRQQAAAPKAAPSQDEKTVVPAGAAQ